MFSFYRKKLHDYLFSFSVTVFWTLLWITDWPRIYSFIYFYLFNLFAFKSTKIATLQSKHKYCPFITLSPFFVFAISCNVRKVSLLFTRIDVRSSLLLLSGACSFVRLGGSGELPPPPHVPGCTLENKFLLHDCDRY